MQQYKNLFKTKNRRKIFINNNYPKQKRGTFINNNYQKQKRGTFSYLQYKYTYFNTYYLVKLQRNRKRNRFRSKFQFKKSFKPRFKRRIPYKKRNYTFKRMASFVFKRNLDINRKYTARYNFKLVRRCKKVKNTFFFYKYQSFKRLRVLIPIRYYKKKSSEVRKPVKKALKKRRLRKRRRATFLKNKYVKFRRPTINKKKVLIQYMRHNLFESTLLQERMLYPYYTGRMRKFIAKFKRRKVKLVKRVVRRLRKKKLKRRIKSKKKSKRFVNLKGRYKPLNLKGKRRLMRSKVKALRKESDIYFQKIKYKSKYFLCNLTNYYSKNLWLIQKNKQILHNNLANISYYYYYKRNKRNKLLFDKLNYKSSACNLNFNLIELKQVFKLVLFLLFRVYSKRLTLRINTRKELHNSKKVKKQKKLKNLTIESFICEYNEDINKQPNLIINKKYLLLNHKKYLLQVLLKLNLGLMRQIETKSYNLIIKNLIKFLIIPQSYIKDTFTKKKFKKANKILYMYSQLILYNIKQFINYKTYILNFYGLIEENINADMLLKRILKTMDITKSLKWLILNMVRKLEKSKSFFGFKVKFAGRLSANIMARVDIIQKGLISTNNMNVYIDFAKDAIVFKYGKCGIKVWLVRNLFVYMPYKYVYSYKYENNKIINENSKKNKISEIL